MENDFFLNLTDTFYKQLLDSLDEGIYFVDKLRQINFWNQGALRITGYSSEEVVGRFCGDKILDHTDFNGKYLCGDGCPLSATIRDGEIRKMDVFLKHKHGHRLPVQVIAGPVFNRAGEIIGAVERFQDITPQLTEKSRMAGLLTAANTDPLTEIANRRYLEMILLDRFYRLSKYKDNFGVMFVDMDKLKDINDQFGHVAGDRAIKIVANTLAATFRSDDLVGRWGGDEFLVILNNVDIEQLENIRQKVKIVISGTQLPADCGGGAISVSIGLAQAFIGDSPEELVRRSDFDMYEDKRLKRKCQ